MGDADSTKSLAIFYYSAWKNTGSAQAFAKMYADSLGRKYSGLKEDVRAERSGGSNRAETEQVYSTNEGPVVITTRGDKVFVAESFPLETARTLTALILDAQGTGALKMARNETQRGPALKQVSYTTSGALSGSSGGALSGSIVRFFANCGAMKTAVDGAIAGIR